MRVKPKGRGQKAAVPQHCSETQRLFGTLVNQNSKSGKSLQKKVGLKNHSNSNEIGFSFELCLALTLTLAACARRFAHFALSVLFFALKCKLGKNQKS